jgi:hypothetical protein
MGEVHLFGIRHHGPGSARSLERALHALGPDLVLIEGPPDADDLLPLAAHAGLEPPVALLVYVPDRPRQAVLYPFAVYSPEWRAIQHALRAQIPVRFIDLPQWSRMAPEEVAGEDHGVDDVGAPQVEAPAEPRGDPLAPMALAAGFADAERWWDHLVESRSGQDLDVFKALHEMMTALREQLAESPPLEEQRREAHMRKCLRAAMAEGHERIAVVCGAWHTPALANLPSAKSDEVLLKGMNKVKTAAAWVPWSYERLSYRSGYGAGVESPVWYELLWQQRTALGEQWLTRAARLLRDEDVPVSSAHIIEACRLAEALAAVRERAVPSLPEFNDAAIAVLGNGNAVNLRIIERRWHFGERLGRVPEEFPAAPLAQDLAAQQKRLRLPPRAEEKRLDLDLREPVDRERSHLLRRLRLLGVEWGKPVTQSGGRGTFHEYWQLTWKPEFAIQLIESSRHGHTVAQAAAGILAERSAASDTPLRALIALLEDALFADLADAIGVLVAAVENRAALSMDVHQLLAAVPPLVAVQRYGNVRDTDVSMVDEILRGLVPRVFVALPPAAVGIDDDAARAVHGGVVAMDGALANLGNDLFIPEWRETLLRISRNDAAHPLLAGHALRLLYDAQVVGFDALELSFARSLSPGNPPAQAAGWAEGFLSGSGSILIHDDKLLGLVDGWLRGVTDEHFMQVLPLLRRTFAHFPPAERRQIGERLRPRTDAQSTPVNQEFDVEAAQAVLPLLRRIWNSGEPQ